MRLGFIGLGVMGRPIALHLMCAGHEMAVWARRPESAAPLVQAGAVACASPAELASRCEALFTMVTHTSDVEQVLFGAQGVVHGARPGLTCVDMSTILPSATVDIAARLAQRGVDFVDAPVSGGEQGAVEATLAIMCGAKEEAFARVEPLLKVVGRRVVRIGDPGAGQVAKACNQLFIACAQQGVAEAMVLAKAGGLDRGRMLAAVCGGSAWSRILEMQGARMVSRDFRAGIQARLHHKDAQIALDAAHAIGLALPGTAIAAQTFNALIGSEGGEIDSAAMLLPLERANGMG